jgi:hypothetical protein
MMFFEELSGNIVRINKMAVLLFLLSLCSCKFIPDQAERISIFYNENGCRLQIEGKDFFIKGMNWDYFPIGTNYNYVLWQQTDEFIKKALDTEMALLMDMGVNAIRVYSGIPPKWISYIHENYGIYTMLNHSFGRYGLTLDGEWVAHTDYADPRTEKLLLNEITQLAAEYKNTSGLLMYLIGNENNYGLFWDGAETENIPAEDKKSTEKARDMYTLFNKAALTIKNIDTLHPVALCNGDLQFLNLIAENCKGFDIFGTNIYRGKSFGDAFERVKSEYGKPILFTEFGADAYNMKTKTEDQESQAHYIMQNWKEIYKNAAGIGKAENCLGGFTFQFSDGWWKYGQTLNLDVHDTEASWSNGGYLYDFVPGENNMNEEWFGICAKGKTNKSGHYDLIPRAAYYALKKNSNLCPYKTGITLETISLHFEIR